MRIREGGTPQGRPVVLVHGLASSSRCWERTVPSLQADHRLLLVDLFEAATGGFGLEAAAAELSLELASRRVRGADLVGHSMGGLIALHVAASWPAMVSSLVLVDVPALRPIRRGRVAQIGAVARSSISVQASAVSLVVGSLMRTNPLSVLAAIRATMAADLAPQAAAAAAAAIPTLLVWGADDHIVPVEVGERLERQMPAATLVIIPGAGHQPMWERPDAFNTALRAFLTR